MGATVDRTRRGARARRTERGAPRRPRGPRLAIDSEDVRRGLGRLVVVIVEVIRELLERQAVRRVAVGDLAGADVERLGLALRRLAEESEGLKRHFGVRDEDLRLTLGPLLELR